MLAGCVDDPDPEREKFLTIDRFPAAVGAYWRYQVYDSLANQYDTAVISVDNSTPIPGGGTSTQWTIAFRDSAQSLTAESYSDHIVWYNNLQVAVNWLEFPLYLTSAWAVPAAGLDSGYVRALEDIQSEYGTFFDAFKVETRASGLNYSLTYDNWYASNVGMVYSERSVLNPGLVERTRWSLIEFSIP